MTSKSNCHLDDVFVVAVLGPFVTMELNSLEDLAAASWSGFLSVLS